MSEGGYDFRSLALVARLAEMSKKIRSGDLELSGVGGFYARRNAQALIRDQRVGLHRVQAVSGRRAICTCGLRLSAVGLDLLTVPGHLNPATFSRVDRLWGYARTPARGRADLGLRLRAHCQRCGWNQLGQHPLKMIQFVNAHRC
jgi:hypothetical protein